MNKTGQYNIIKVQAGYTEQGGQPELYGGRSCVCSPDTVVTSTLYKHSSGLMSSLLSIFQGLSCGGNSRVEQGVNFTLYRWGYVRYKI